MYSTAAAATMVVIGLAGDSQAVHARVYDDSHDSGIELDRRLFQARRLFCPG
ncbi:MAG: hypothetical protein H6669_01810 [Ardenticatenaceae bacterium]|nr:hypothetical protein [Ardenticatenaceae bacterium]